MSLRDDYEIFYRAYALGLLVERVAPFSPGRGLNESVTISPVTSTDLSSESDNFDFHLSPEDIEDALAKFEDLPALIHLSEYASARYSTDLDFSYDFRNAARLCAQSNGLGALWDDLEILGIDWIAESLSTIYSKLSATNDVDHRETQGHDWEPLPLDYEAPEATEAITALERAADAIEADNGYAANLPNERNTIVHLLRSSIQAFHDRVEPTYVFVKFGVIQPLQKAAKRFAGNAKEAAIKGALEAIKEWVKDLIKGQLWS